MLAVKCYICDPAGPWHQEPVELIRKPAGKADLWPVPPDAAEGSVDCGEAQPVLPQQP